MHPMGPDAGRAGPFDSPSGIWLNEASSPRARPLVLRTGDAHGGTDVDGSDRTMTLIPSTAAPSMRDMVWIPGGVFRMGSDEHYPEERPVHEVAVDGFWMDEHQVTVAEFRRFVKATGHVTVAERALDRRRLSRRRPGAARAGLARLPGGPRGPVDLNDYRNWWHWVPGAQWRHPMARAATSPGAIAIR